MLTRHWRNYEKYMKKIFYILVFGINLFSLQAKSFADEKDGKKMNLEALVLNEKIDIMY